MEKKLKTFHGTELGNLCPEGLGSQAQVPPIPPPPFWSMKCAWNTAQPNPVRAMNGLLLPHNLRGDPVICEAHAVSPVALCRQCWPTPDLRMVTACDLSAVGPENERLWLSQRETAQREACVDKREDNEIIISKGHFSALPFRPWRITCSDHPPTANGRT